MSVGTCVIISVLTMKSERTRRGLKSRRREHSREILERTTYDLRERIKELNCLYSISSIVEQHGISLEEILQRTAEVIPPAWQYPEITCSCITVRDRIYQTDDFRQTPWMLSQPIVFDGEEMGMLEICYLQEKPTMDEGPFLKEERSLIRVIAERIGGIVRRKEAEAGLKESEAHNRALLNAIPDLMFRINRDGALLDFHEGRFPELRSFLSGLIGQNLFAFALEKQLVSKRLVDQGVMYLRRAFETGRTQAFEQQIPLAESKGDFEIRIVSGRANEALAMVRDITLRKRLEREILEIAGREQRRIGQDLHDSLCQHLAGVGFMAKVLERKIQAGSNVEAPEAGELVGLIDQAITLTRGFARGLTPVSLEEEGLMEALTQLAANTEKMFGITCRFVQDEPVLIEDNSVATHLYRIVQEALNNAIKHGKADTIEIVVQSGGRAHTVSVRDNGTGFAVASAQGKGMGLNIMNYRASMIGATLDVRNNENHGTIVSCTFPNKRYTS